MFNDFKSINKPKQLLSFQLFLINELLVLKEFKVLGNSTEFAKLK